MKITDLLKKDGINLGVTAEDQNAAIDELVGLHEKSGNLNSVSEFKKAILAREEKGSTAIGMGIAVPHAKSAAVARAGLTAMTIPEGVDYKSLDGNPSKLFFMIAAPDTAADTHLEVLSKLMTLLMDQAFSKKLIEAKTADEFLSIIDEKEAAKDKEEAEKKAAAEAAKAEKAAEATKAASKKLLGVTACPTGIAHTFMAAEALELKAKEMGLSIKVEKDGSAGAKDPLTAAEIAEADAIIIACDKNIDMGKFDGKNVIITSTKEAIHNPEALINKAVKGETTVYHHTGHVTKASDAENESVGRKLYKHLMNGGGDVDSQPVEGEDEAVVPSLGVELQMSLSGVVGGDGLNGKVVSDLECVAVGHHGAVAKHLGAALVRNQLGVFACQLVDGRGVKMVVMFVGDEDVVRFGHGSVVDGLLP